jgi:hypothetical protein
MLFIFARRDDEREPLVGVALFDQRDRLNPTPFNHTGIWATTAAIRPTTTVVAGTATGTGATMKWAGEIDNDWHKL